MAFVLPRVSHHLGQPSTQSQSPQIAGIDSEHAQSPISEHPHDMAREKEHRPRIEILLDSPFLVLKGTGSDVEPALLSGHVAIYINDSTPIKEIKLQLKGKAHLPAPTSDLGSMNPPPLTYTICTHDWSFLEGEKKTGHTLKAGRHLFPFQLRVGGSLPSTLSSAFLGGAEVSYKLRAQVVRPTFAFHQTYTASRPVYIIRSLIPDALEYQQTLELENTWPEKLMYSIIIPHKAWAAGDKISAIVKLSPLAKGICLLHSTTSIHEQVKISARGTLHDHTRVVASVKHEFVNGNVNEVEDTRAARPRSQGSSPAHTPFESIPSHSNPSLGRQSTPNYFTPHHTPPPPLPVPELPITPSSNVPIEGIFADSESSDVVARLDIRIPLTITPTHSLEPLIVTHRVRWNFVILNKDGHTSELRCSLPIHLLDHRLLNESRKHSAGARRFILGEGEVPVVEEDNTQLPSYDQHVRDRVANMYISDAAALRVSNPWILHGTSPVHAPNASSPSLTSVHSGHSTPAEPHSPTHLSYQPDSNSLEWVNSELLLSLSDEPLQMHSLGPRSPPHAADSGTDSSEPPSRTPSRTQNRVRNNQNRRSGHGHLVGLSRFSSRTTSPERHHPTTIPQPSIANPSSETYTHNGSKASRSTDLLLTATMKPSSSFHPGGWMPRSSSTQQIPTLHEFERVRETTPSSATSNASTASITSRAPARALSVPDLTAGTELLHRAFTRVPDYGVASRGFIGGVPPLSSMHGLPSYDETVRRNRWGQEEQEQEDVDLSRRFASFSVGGQEGGSPPRSMSGSPIST